MYQLHAKILSFFYLAMVAGYSIAGNGVDSAKIHFKTFANGRPQSVTAISGQVVKNLRLFGGVLPNGVSWEDGHYRSLQAYESQICRLTNEPCVPFSGKGVRIHEVYIGGVDGVSLPQIGNLFTIGLDSLVDVGYGAKKIILLNVEDMGQKMQSATVFFDGTLSDEEMRQVALEDAVFRVLRFRD